VVRRLANRNQAIPAMTSSNDGPLLTGPVRAYKDHKEKCIVVETTKDNPAGYGLVVCTLDLFSVREARVIVAIPDLLRGLEPFAALGRRLAEADGDAPLITDTGAKLDITVGDLQRVAAACARVFPPPGQTQTRPKMRRAPKRRHRPH
jgi:hypothetical protein